MSINVSAKVQVNMEHYMRNRERNNKALQREAEDLQLDALDPGKVLEVSDESTPLASEEEAIIQSLSIDDVHSGLCLVPDE